MLAFDPISAAPLAGSEGTRATLYYVVVLAAEATPSAAQIRAGLNAAGSAAVRAHNEAAPAAPGTVTFPAVTGLDAGSYKAAFVWTDGYSESTVAVTDTFVVGTVSIPVGRADETDAAYALAAVQRLAVALAAETDTAQALAALQSTAAGLATEADAALALAAVQRLAAGLATEANTASALGAVLRQAAGLALETDTAAALVPYVPGGVGIAYESDAAYALGSVHRRPVGLATETSAALALGAVQAITAGMALEIDTSFAAASLQARAVGRADESDTASALLAGSGGGGGTGATAAEIVAALMAEEVEPGVSVRMALQVILAAVSGRTDGIGTSTERYFDPAGAVARITATFDANNNRSSVTLDGA